MKKVCGAETIVIVDPRPLPGDALLDFVEDCADELGDGLYDVVVHVRAARTLMHLAAQVMARREKCTPKCYPFNPAPSAPRNDEA
jgi:hypothetical protein